MAGVDIKVWSLEGRALKLDTREDIQPHLTDLVSNEHVEEIILQGNTIGIGASEEFADVLKKKAKAHVCAPFLISDPALTEMKMKIKSQIRTRANERLIYIYKLW